MLEAAGIGAPIAVHFDEELQEDLFLEEFLEGHALSLILCRNDIAFSQIGTQLVVEHPELNRGTHKLRTVVLIAGSHVGLHRSQGDNLTIETRSAAVEEDNLVYQVLELVAHIVLVTGEVGSHLTRFLIIE